MARKETCVWRGGGRSLACDRRRRRHRAGRSPPGRPTCGSTHHQVRWASNPQTQKGTSSASTSCGSTGRGTSTGGCGCVAGVAACDAAVNEDCSGSSSSKSDSSTASKNSSPLESSSAARRIMTRSVDAISPNEPDSPGEIAAPGKSAQAGAQKVDLQRASADDWSTIHHLALSFTARHRQKQLITSN